MTTNASFKRRVRARMARTGEKYGAARRVLLERAGHLPGRRRRIAEPEVDDDAVSAATGRDWDAWVALVDDRPDTVEGHQALARWLADEHGVDAWWSQTVAIGYERITGLRAVGQQSDGSFAANRSRTLVTDDGLDAAALRALLLDDADREDLFGGLATELRSRPGTKALRIGMPEGVAIVAIEDVRAAGRPDRLRVAVQHGGLAAADQVEEWKAFWGDWLEALAAD